MTNEQVTGLIEAIKTIGVVQQYDGEVSVPSALQDISFALNGNQNISSGRNVTNGLFAIANSIRELASVLREIHKDKSKS